MANGTIGVSQIDVLTTSGTGTLSIVPPATNTNRTLTLPDGTGTIVANGVNGSLVSGTAKAFNWNGVSTNTFIDFTSIPSWIKRVTVNVTGVSTTGTSDWGVRLGTSGGVVSTGYAGGCSNTGAGIINPTNIALSVYSAQAATLSSGSIVISLANPATNTWVFAGTIGTSSYGYSSVSGFFVSLSGVLTTVRITTGNGTDTFDAGTINIIYE